MLDKPTILAIDQGTTSSRAILFSANNEVLEFSQKELKQYYPQKGWVEQDPEDIWQDTLAVCRDVFEKSSDAKRCEVIGITNQRETTIIWNRMTGKPVYNAIVWQDRRTAEFCQNKFLLGKEEMIRRKTGLLTDPYFSCSKIKWILDHVEGVKEKAVAGELAFGTVDSFLLWRFTGGKVHATDATNASRTGLFNIIEQKWDQELLTLYDIPLSLFPEVKDNVAFFGETSPDLLGRPIIIGAMAGDQHAALVGQCCFEAGMMKSTYGTGCFVLMNMGEHFRISKNRLLTTIAYRIHGKVTYAIEGSIFTAGSAVQWLRDNLKIIEDASETEAWANSVDDTNGVFFVPAFTGLGAPHWRPEARAAISGLTRESSRAHIVRAALEAQAYQTADLLAAIDRDTGLYPAMLRADGGLLSNNFVCQFLADVLQILVEIPKINESTALGVAYLAGLQAGIYENFDELKDLWRSAKVYRPQMSSEHSKRLYNNWQHNLQQFLK